LSKKQINIRDVPESLYEWIENERHAKRVSQKEFLLRVLEKAALFGYESPQPTLFNLKSAESEQNLSPFPFTFIDLFAGIGGMRLGLQWAGGRSVFSCEWDRYAQKTYYHWFNETPHGDIRKIRPEDIPDHDILAAGFPCQPFSIAGVSKKNSLGKLHGFKDESQGNLFFYLANIVSVKRPLALILENVKNLISHDKGRTWKTISETLQDLDYRFFYSVIDARDYVPQHRERIFIVCFDRHVFGNEIPFDFPEKKDKQNLRLRDILEKDCPEKYTLSDHLWNYLQTYAERHRQKGNGFGFGLADTESISRTLSARYYKDGSEILIPQQGLNPRRLTPRECARLMGFPDVLPIVVSDTQAYRQFGNALVPQIASEVAKKVVAVFRWHANANGLIKFNSVTENHERQHKEKEAANAVSAR